MSEIKDEIRRLENSVDLHAAINRSVALALGLPDGTSWHDLGERVRRIVGRLHELDVCARGPKACDLEIENLQKALEQKSLDNRRLVVVANHNHECFLKAKRYARDLRTYAERYALQQGCGKKASTGKKCNPEEPQCEPCRAIRVAKLSLELGPVGDEDENATSDSGS